ncbi:MAG: hypothetical protein JOZ31_23425 [Verrucomicrobia bacterium]|nr:hypothetical protein [Verrucomicrobiota bacterium]
MTTSLRIILEDEDNDSTALAEVLPDVAFAQSLSVPPCGEVTTAKDQYDFFRQP